MSDAIIFGNVDIVFGDRPDAALALIDKGSTRDEINAQTGLVLGVANASLSVSEGEILVLMGLSGSGKSTLVRAVNGLAPVVRGSVSVKTKSGYVDPYRCPAKALRDLRMHTVSMVFQQFGLLPWRNVADNVGFGLELSGVPEAERKRMVAEQLELVNLSAWADRKVGAFRRHAAACGPGPGLRHRRTHSFDGRAVLGARSPHQKPPSGRTPRIPEPVEENHSLRQP